MILTCIVWNFISEINYLNSQRKTESEIVRQSCRAGTVLKGFGEGWVLAGEVGCPRCRTWAQDLTESTQIFVQAKFPGTVHRDWRGLNRTSHHRIRMAAMDKSAVSSQAKRDVSPALNWEQIRTTIAYNNRPVIIVRFACGVRSVLDGGTPGHRRHRHPRVIPAMTVISPCIISKPAKSTLACVVLTGPVYLRLAREKTPVITTTRRR